jgi:phosphatidylserine decarboxylase
MKISNEGRFVIPAMLVILAGVAAGIVLLLRLAGVSGCWVWALLEGAAFVTWLLVIWFFRVPNRPQLTDDEVVFSPCDGTVVVCEDVVESEVLGRKCLQVSIFMSITNVHINWFPVGGRVSYFRHHNGRFMIASHPKSSDENEHTTTAVEMPSGETVVFRQVAGFVARRIVSYARVGEVVAQNTPCGFIKFGSRVDIYLPLTAEILVGLGQKVEGSQTPIARFKRH